MSQGLKEKAKNKRIMLKRMFAIAFCNTQIAAGYSWADVSQPKFCQPQW